MLSHTHLQGLESIEGRAKTCLPNFNRISPEGDIWLPTTKLYILPARAIFNVPVLSVDTALVRGSQKARAWHPIFGAACFTSGLLPVQ